MKEEIRIIDGTDGRYAVSNMGIVYSYYDNFGRKRETPKELSRCPTHGGYLRVRITYADGTKKTVKVHRLVALAFIPNPNGYLVINHKDENKTNNRADNLEWCTVKYNTNYGSCPAKLSASLSGEKNPMYGRTGPLNPMYGRKHSQETRAKIAEKSRNISDETRAKMSEAAKALKRSGKRNPAYKKVCPLVLYTQYVILNKSLYTMSKELGVGRHALSKKIKEYGITRKEEH